MYWIKNTKERSTLCLTRSVILLESFLSVRVLVFSVLNVNELICGLTCSRTLNKQCIYWQDIFLKAPLLIYLKFFPNFFFQNSSFQTQGGAYLRVRLMRRCLRYVVCCFHCVVSRLGKIININTEKNKCINVSLCLHNCLLKRH